jgi:hypothetical protein
MPYKMNKKKSEIETKIYLQGLVNGWAVAHVHGNHTKSPQPVSNLAAIFLSNVISLRIPRETLLASFFFFFY